MTNSNKLYSSTVEEDENGDCFITFHPELLQQLGWTENDTLSWKITDKGATIEMKKEEKPLELVQILQKDMAELTQSHYSLLSKYLELYKKYSELQNIFINSQEDKSK